MGSVDWGGRLPKRNGGALRFPQRDWKPRVECKGIRELDCETGHVEQVRKQGLVILRFCVERP